MDGWMDGSIERTTDWQSYWLLSLHYGDCVDGCEESEYFLLPFCYTQCPKYFYAANETTSSAESVGRPRRAAVGLAARHHQPRAVCLRCHPSCLRCSGPADDDCLNCTVHRRLTLAGRCVEVDTEHHHMSPLVITAIVLLPLTVIGIAAASVWLWLRRRRNTSRSGLVILLASFSLTVQLMSVNCCR